MAKPMKYFLSLLFAVSVPFTPSAHAGSIVTAATCNRPDVQVVINAAQDGDTVVIPAGTCHWTTNLTVSPHAVTIQGAGIDQTIIVDDVPKGVGEDRLLMINLPTTGFFRLTGMTFQGGNTVTGYNGTVILQGLSHTWRLDHLKFDKLKTVGIHTYGHLYGVIDHCTFDLTDSTGQAHHGIEVWHDAWNNHSYGDGSFADQLYLGTEKAVYIEDNTFMNSVYVAVDDIVAGGRMVFRYNTLTNSFFATHGTETSDRYRGVRSYEIYNNTLTYPIDPVTGAGAWAFGLYLRGGTGVIFNNTFTGFVSAIIMANYRSPGLNQTSPIWGLCDGTNAWDENVGLQTGYACLDQVGRGTSDLLVGSSPTPAWPHQVSQPLYGWANTWNPVHNNPGALMGSQSAVIQENRDYFTNTPLPGYTPYTYPHPLTLTGPLPSPPTSLRLN